MERGVMPTTYPIGSAYGRIGPVEARLSGTGRLADDLWLLAHHEVSGRPLLHARQLGLGLAGGLLAELMPNEHPAIVVWYDNAVTLGPRVQPGSVGAHPLLKQIAAEPQALPARDWLLYLARSAGTVVGQRLEQAGYLTRARRVIPGRGARLVPVDRDWAFAPVTRISGALRDRSAQYGVVLGGLAVACGLGYRLDPYLPDAAQRVEAAVARLPDGMRRLITQTRTAACAAVLART